MLSGCAPEGRTPPERSAGHLVGSPSSWRLSFHGTIRNPKRTTWVRSSAREPPSPHDLFPGARLAGAMKPRALRRTDNSPSDPDSGRQPTVGAAGRTRPRNCCHNTCCGHGILTVSPFGASGRRPRPAGSVSRLRTDSPEAKHSYFGNLALFGLQESHLNSCYYNQDLHSRPLHAPSRVALHRHTIETPSYTPRPRPDGGLPRRLRIRL